MNTNPQLKSALAYDPIAEAEKLAGESYKENEAVVWLGIGLMHKQRQEKDALLFLNRDTVFGMTFADYCERVEEMGFRRIYEETFNGGYKGHESETFAIWWHPEGLLLTGESHGTSLNVGHVYFNFRGPREAMDHCSNGFAIEDDGVPVWQGSRDTREGLRFALDEMRAAGQFLPHWVRSPFVWLLNYAEPKQEGYDYNAINARKIAMLPVEVQQAIHPTP